MRQLPRIARPRQPTTPIFQQNSVHKREALVPIHVATSKPLEGDWVGHELNDVRVIGSMFGGPHYILQLGYEQRVGYAASFRLVFVAHMPATSYEEMGKPEVIEDAKRTAVAFMHMLNMRRKEPVMATAPPPRYTTKERLLQELKELEDTPIHDPKPPLVGKRADMLIVDEISDITQPQPRNQP